MQILILQGSPRAKGNTAWMAEEFKNAAEAGLEALRNWMQEIGLPLTISEIGATPDMIDNIVSTTVIYPAGYLDLTPEDIKAILKESL